MSTENLLADATDIELDGRGHIKMETPVGIKHEDSELPIIHHVERPIARNADRNENDIPIGRNGVRNRNLLAKRASEISNTQLRNK